MTTGFYLNFAILPSPHRRPTGLEELNTSKHEVGGLGVTVDSLITHTPRDRPKGMRYEGVCVIGEVDLYGSEI